MVFVWFWGLRLGDILLKSWCINWILKKMVRFHEMEGGIGNGNSEAVSNQRGHMGKPNQCETKH